MPSAGPLDFQQAGRLIEIDTPLGEDKLLLQRYTGTEAMSRLFRFDADLLAQEYINFSDIIGQSVTITVNHPDAPRRYINGIVNRFAFVGKRERFHYFRAEIVPWLWKLTQAANCRIFQNKNVIDIIQTIFTDRGFQDFKDSTQKSYEPREYCVQYRETDFAFVSRLMEEEGIFYFFEHVDGKHTLVIADSHDSNSPCPNQAQARYEQTRGILELDEDVVTDINTRQELRSGKYTSTDYNFETPSTSLVAESPSTVDVGGNSKLEVFDYPGIYMKKDHGSKRTDVRMQEIESDHLLATGASHCRAFLPGYRFDLTGHPVPALNATYLLVEVNSRASVGSAYTDNKQLDAGGYDNTFTAIPYSVPFRPRRTTQKSVVEGPHSAIVSGPSGEEVYADKYGRIKVQFYWDREGKGDESSSCWVRVSQAWAGDQFGSMWIPRIGQEVIVDYLEGDPDRPIITGRVYNAMAMPPYDLPDKSTVSTFKSRSSKGGSSDDFNEIRFEDKKGSEQLFMRAQKDMDLNVNEDFREFITKDHHEVVVGDDISLVGGDKHVAIEGNRIESIGKALSITIGSSLDESIGSSMAVAAGETMYLKAGMTLVVEAGVQLTLKGPGGFVDIGPAGVTIQGTMVLINSGGAGASGSGPNTQTPKHPDSADDGTKFTKL